MSVSVVRFVAWKIEFMIAHAKQPKDRLFYLAQNRHNYLRVACVINE